jgi:hypothetical protein
VSGSHKEWRIRKVSGGLTIVKALEGRDCGISACCLHLGSVDVEASAEDLGAVSGIPEHSVEPKKVKEIAEIAVLISTPPPRMYMLEAIVLPVKQAYLRHG